MPDKNAVPSFTYVFTLEPKLECTPVGEIPSGFRMDLRYVDGSKVTTKAERYQPWLTKKAREGVVKILRGLEDAQKKEILSKLTDPRGRRLAKLPEKPEQITYQVIREARDRIREPGPGAPARPEPARGLLQDLRDNRDLEWFGMEGEILSGGDWATVRRDGVATFDGRTTLRGDDGFLIDAVFSGVVDLRDPETESLEEQQAFSNWLRGTIDRESVPVTLAAHFEGANATESWANDKIKAASEHYWKYERLVRGQFVAVGAMVLGKTTYSPVTSLTLDICEVGVGP